MVIFHRFRCRLAVANFGMINTQCYVDSCFSTSDSICLFANIFVFSSRRLISLDFSNQLFRHGQEKLSNLALCLMRILSEQSTFLTKYKLFCCFKEENFMASHNFYCGEGVLYFGHYSYSIFKYVPTSMN